MKLSFFGAAQQVTGSCSCIEALGKTILVDYGMPQGEDSFGDAMRLPIPAGRIDYVLLTHAHIDHSGYLPLLAKYGFKGTIFATAATVDLCRIMLMDSAHIQEFEAEWRSRKAKRAGRDYVEPIYTTQDALDIIERFSPCSYMDTVEIAEGLTVEFFDAGHLLGSANIAVNISDGGVKRRIMFSGDIGNINQPILEDPTYHKKHADFVVMESTYGDREHTVLSVDYVTELAKITQEALEKGGNLVIPSFAVGRTQELLYFYRKIKEQGLVTVNPDFKVYVDSPLAVEATQVFSKYTEGYYDEEAIELVRRGINPLSFKGLEVSVTSENSKAINFDSEPKVIIAASGMCDAGRIKHHLKHNLWREDSTLLFVGYQANGTLGRHIYNGAKSVKLFGEEVEIRANVLTMRSMSGHADRAGLLKWIASFENPPREVFVVHGEAQVSHTFAQELRLKYSLNAVVPNLYASYDLVTGECIEYGEEHESIIARQTTKKKKGSAVFVRLLSVCDRLVNIIENCSGRPNKELAKIADQITALCDKIEH